MKTGKRCWGSKWLRRENTCLHLGTGPDRAQEDILHRQLSQEIYYYNTPGGYKADFYLAKTQQLIQVAQSLDAQVIRERELRALAEAVQSVKVKEALILSDRNEESLEVNGVPVEVHSVSEWLLTQ